MPKPKSAKPPMRVEPKVRKPRTVGQKRQQISTSADNFVRPATDDPSEMLGPLVDPIIDDDDDEDDPRVQEID